MSPPIRFRLYQSLTVFFSRIFDQRLIRSPRLKLELSSCPVNRPLVGSEDVRPISDQVEQTSMRRPIWIHAASAGELEGIQTVVLELARIGQPIFLTVFSPSATRGFLKLKERLEEMGQWFGGGLSPSEGSWLSAFKVVEPRFFITVKYEAWPEQWASAALCGVPVYIVGAKARRSLRIASWFLTRVLDLARPQIHMLTLSEADRLSLLSWRWDNSHVYLVKDPRWDQVNTAPLPSRFSQDRSTLILQAVSVLNLPRPWGMLGNSWVSDYRKLPSLSCPGVLGSTLWVIPHQVQGYEVAEQVRILQAAGWRVLRTSQWKSGEAVQFTGDPVASKPVCIFVDELGVLKSLYREADFVYVGGGFGRGIHSVIEPTVGGAPILIGPKGSDDFVEVRDLISSGDLRVIGIDSELLQVCRQAEQWSEELRTKGDAAGRLAARTGGTIDVLSVLFGA